MIIKESHTDVVEMMHLPRVGDIIKNKKFGSMWKVLEEREVWETIDDDPETGEPRMVPAVAVSICRLKDGTVMEKNRTMSHAYTLHEDPFESNWEILTKH